MFSRCQHALCKDEEVLPALSPFLPVTSNELLNNIIILNQHILNKKANREDKHTSYRETARQTDKQADG